MILACTATPATRAPTQMPTPDVPESAFNCESLTENLANSQTDMTARGIRSAWEGNGCPTQVSCEFLTSNLAAAQTDMAARGIRSAWERNECPGKVSKVTSNSVILPTQPPFPTNAHAPTPTSTYRPKQPLREASLSGTKWDFISEYQGTQIIFQYSFLSSGYAGCVGHDLMCPSGYVGRWQESDETRNGQRVELDYWMPIRSCTTATCPSLYIRHTGTRIADSMSGTASNSEGESWSWTATLSE